MIFSNKVGFILETSLSLFYYDMTIITVIKCFMTQAHDFFEMMNLADFIEETIIYFL
jgi:hypothetical protein